MSRWTGKCDFCDSVENGWVTKDKDIYVGGIGPLRVKTWEDLIPYYTCLTMGASQDVHNVDTKSWIDTEEEQCLSWRKEAGLRAFRKYKRKFKRIPTKEEFINEVSVGEFELSDSYVWDYIYKCLSDKNYGEKSLCLLHLRSYNKKRLDFILFAFRHHKMNHPFVVRLQYKILEFNDGIDWRKEMPNMQGYRNIWHENE